MAKKKEIIDFKNKNITYTLEGITYKVLLLNKASMNVELSCFEKGKFTQNKTIPFAHLPKSIKSLIKPNNK
ncbi:hypothetical protein LXN10_15480 [Arcobacter sp. KX21116]|uniref:hypothetical protein n=1 Tax=Arcobacter iocasae TaxID=2906515 RepID=UPI0035D4B7A9